MNKQLMSFRFLHARSASLLAVVAFGAIMSTPVMADESVARQWNEQMLEAIRHDFARPTVHARNLFHVSVAMYDAWAIYDGTAEPYLVHESQTAQDVAAARNEAISFAAYRVLKARFSNSPGSATTQAALDGLMDQLGYNKNYFGTIGSSPAAVGNRIAIQVLAYGLGDGANEAGAYTNLYYATVNPPVVPALPGNPDLLFPNRWQPIALDFFIDQNDNLILGGYPAFLSPEWGNVKPFAMNEANRNIYMRDGDEYWVYEDPGPPPLYGGVGEEYYKWGFELVAAWSGHLDPTDGVMIDVSPNSIGNAPLPNPDQYEEFYDRINGGDWSPGYAENPVTHQPYPTQMVPRGDYCRILAEFWADGPSSETPPGHWFTILNYVSDHPSFEKRFAGSGPVIDDLEWDVKSYLALGGAMHDVAISAWGVKGWYDFIRPVSAIRFLADNGQCTDPMQPSYNPNGIDLIPGHIEVVTTDTTMPGQRHEHLAGYEGKIAVKAWRGPDWVSDPATEFAGVDWILAENWWPYQRPTFVSPPFAGYVSGHSTYSRAAAEVMTLLTGSPYFPDGLGEFECPQNDYLVFEQGPSVTVTLQWASYRDASDQCSLSRIWGGIHPPCDDIPGRHMGRIIGPRAFAKALNLFEGAPLAGDVNCDGVLDSLDAQAMVEVLLDIDNTPCHMSAADTDRNGYNDGDDIKGFIDILLN